MITPVRAGCPNIILSTLYAVFPAITATDSEPRRRHRPYSFTDPRSRRRMFASDADISPIYRDECAVLLCFVHAGAPFVDSRRFLPSA
jgi:hypothetical protein